MRPLILRTAGWQVCGVTEPNIHGASGMAIHEFPLLQIPSPIDVGKYEGGGRQFADYLLYMDGKAAGVMEAKKQGVTLSGIDTLGGICSGVQIKRLRAIAARESVGPGESLEAHQRRHPLARVRLHAQ